MSGKSIPTSVGKYNLVKLKESISDQIMDWIADGFQLTNENKANVITFILLIAGIRDGFKKGKDFILYVGAPTSVHDDPTLEGKLDRINEEINGMIPSERPGMTLISNFCFNMARKTNDETHKCFDVDLERKNQCLLMSINQKCHVKIPAVYFIRWEFARHLINLYDKRLIHISEIKIEPSLIFSGLTHISKEVLFYYGDKGRFEIYAAKYNIIQSPTKQLISSPPSSSLPSSFPSLPSSLPSFLSPSQIDSLQQILLQRIESKTREAQVANPTSTTPLPTNDHGRPQLASMKERLKEKARLKLLKKKIASGSSEKPSTKTETSSEAS